MGDPSAFQFIKVPPERGLQCAAARIRWKGRPMLLGATGRLEVVDAPGHAADLARYRVRGYAMAGNRIRIVTDRPASIVEVHPPSRYSMEMAGVTVEDYPPRPAMG